MTVVIASSALVLTGAGTAALADPVDADSASVVSELPDWPTLDEICAQSQDVPLAMWLQDGGIGYWGGNGEVGEWIGPAFVLNDGLTFDPSIDLHGGTLLSPTRAKWRFEYSDCVAEPFNLIDIDGLQFREQILWLAQNGVTRGYREGYGTYTYRPFQSVNRDAMAAFLYRLAGSPAYTPPTQSAFSDVRTDNQFYLEISWLAAQGITTGWETASGREYRPLQPVSRDAMAAFIYRFKGSPSYDGPAYSYFADISDGTQFYREMSWMAAQGITTGWDEGNGRRAYRPLDEISREAMAAFMFRMENGGTPLPDPTPPAEPPATEPPTSDVYYRNCSEVRAAGKAPILRGQPGYGVHLDRDGDGKGCE